jgi:WXXGXW repeat (2 copies)
MFRCSSHRDITLETRMTSSLLSRGGLLAAAAALALLSGCVVAPLGYQPGYAGTEVAVAPPPPQAEVIGVAPAPGFFWIGGNWGWNGRAHYWSPGHWEAPRAGYRWAPHHWVQQGRGWREAPGHWER